MKCQQWRTAMARPRMNQNQLILSGQGELKKKKYEHYNLVPGKVIPKDCKLNPPKHYEKETKKAFKAIASNLIGMGALSEQDLPAFSLMMDSLDDYYKINYLIRFLDENSEKDDDYFKKRDRLLGRKNKAMRDYYLWCGKFGITPTDRTRLSCEISEGKKDKDPLDIILN